VIDTGFIGTLTLPRRIIADLGLPWRGHERALLADGSRRLLDLHEATVDWDGRVRRVLVTATGSVPLIGMRLLYGYRLTVEAVDGGSVSITALTLP
jgi:clan AA aspartic protease